MQRSYATAYETYSQIKWELHRPIQELDLDKETLTRLYESKILYLERLRIQCFLAINQRSPSAFQIRDYEYILLALQSTKEHLCQLGSFFKDQERCKSFMT